MYGITQQGSVRAMTATEASAAAGLPSPLSPVSNSLAAQEQMLNELQQVLDTLQVKLAPCLAPSVQGTGADTPGKTPLESPLVQALERHNGQLVIAGQRLRALVEAVQL